MNFSLEDAQAMRVVWHVLQDELTALSSQGRRYMAENSGHMIQAEQPELVTEKIVELVYWLRGT